MSKKRFTAAIALALAVAFTSLPGLAQQAPLLEEIVITAKFRDTKLIDTVGSVSVISGSTIEERAAKHLQDVLNAAPNVTWASGASRSRFVQIRGVGDLEQFYDPRYYPSVGLMLDDLELADTANAGMLFDISQVEVLRGPQGTRFGASGHAGMVFLRSNAPTDTFSGEVSGGAGNYDSYDMGLVMSGPLSDTLGGRLAVQQNLSDGYLDNDHFNNNDESDFDELTGRARLSWTPNEDARYDLALNYFDTDNGYDVYSLDNDRDTWSDQPGNDSQEVAAATLSADWRLNGALSLEAVVSYLDTDLDQRYDADWVSDDFCERFLCANDTAQEIFERDRDRWTADLRLLGGDDGSGAGASRYVLGVYANNGEEDFDYTYLSALYGDFGTQSNYENKRYALYGEYEYDLTDALTLLAGLRYERFEDDYSDTNGFGSDNDDNLWGGELSARYAFTDETMAYATVARSAKPGGVNTSASANQPFMSPTFQEFTRGKLDFDDETLWNTEIGVRTEQFDRRLSLSAALFYAPRDKAQLENWMWDDEAALWISFLDTSSDTTTYGAELDATFLVNAQLELFARLGWLDAEVDSIEAFDLDLFDFVEKNDRDQAKSPSYQYNLGTRFSLGEHWSGHLEVEGQDDSYFGYYHDGKLGDYNLLNASVQWQWASLAVTLWGRNLTDENYAVHGLYFANDPRNNFGVNAVYEQLGEPRTYGLRMRYAF
jgi:outer membrane receptor protein involved in Fe transport